jgi:hypothetical protein
LNRVVQQVTLPEWFVIFLFSKGMPAAWNKSFILFDVKVFDKYLQHIPREVRFYRKPLVNKGSDKSIRFSVQSIGINTLSNRMKDLFQAAGIPLENRNITNWPL